MAFDSQSLDVSVRYYELKQQCFTSYLIYDILFNIKKVKIDCKSLRGCVNVISLHLTGIESCLSLHMS